MSATLSSSVRKVVTSALPEGAAGDDPTDEDLVRALAASAAALRAALADVKAASGVTNRGGEGALTQAGASAVVDALHRALMGEQVSADDVPAAARKALEDATSLRRRFDELTHALADARGALAAAEGKGAERAREAYARALRHAIAQGRVPDDLPGGPLRDLAGEVAQLRAAAEALRADAVDARKHAEEVERKATERAKQRAEERRTEGQIEREAQKKVKAVERERDQARKALAKAEAELKARAREAEEARAALDLAAHLVGLRDGAKVDDVIARMSERLGVAPPAPAVKVAPAPAPLPPPPPEPPPSHEASWRDLRDGDLALDRKRYARVLDAGREGRELTDQERRFLALRTGDRVVWLRGDGLHEDGTTADDAPAHRPDRMRHTESLRALVIAEDLKGAPQEVRDAWQAWRRAAELAPGLGEALAEVTPEAAS